MASNNTINILMTAQNQASPALKQVASDIDKVSDSSIRSHPGVQVLFADLDKLKQQAAAVQAGMAGSAKAGMTLSQMFSGLQTSVLNIVQTGGPFIGFAVAIVAALHQISNQMTKTIDDIANISQGIASGLQNTIKQVAVIQAQASGDRFRIIEATAAKEIASAEQIKNERIKKAKEENAAVQSSWTALGAQRIAAQAKMVAEIAAAEADLSNKTIVVNEETKAKILALQKERVDTTKALLSAVAQEESNVTQLILKSKGLELSAIKEGLNEQLALLEQRRQKEEEGLTKLYGATAQGEEAKNLLQKEYSLKAIAIEQETADKRIQIIDSMTTKAVSIAKQLGAQFSQEFNKLSIAKFLQDTQAQIKVLEGYKEAIKAGDKNLKDAGVTMADVDRMVNQLKDDMGIAITKGYIPIHDAAQKAADANKELSAALKMTSSDIRTLVSDSLAAAPAMQDMFDRIDALTKAGRAAQAAAGDGFVPVGGGVPGDPTAPGGGSAPAAGGGSAFTTVPNPLAFADGGVVPGPRGQPVRIIAHGGEPIGRPDQLVSAFVEAAQRLSGPSVTAGDSGNVRALHFGPGSITINGDMTSQRDISTFVELLAQEIDKRNIRRNR